MAKCVEWQIGRSRCVGKCFNPDHCDAQLSGPCRPGEDDESTGARAERVARIAAAEPDPFVAYLQELADRAAPEIAATVPSDAPVEGRVRVLLDGRLPASSLILEFGRVLEELDPHNDPNAILVVTNVIDDLTELAQLDPAAAETAGSERTINICRLFRGEWIAALAADEEQLNAAVVAHNAATVQAEAIGDPPGVPAILERAAATFRERNAAYRGNFRAVGPMLRALFPDGIPDAVLHGDGFSLLVLLLVKLSRYAQTGLTHVDSIHDAMVYSAMLEALTSAPKPADTPAN